MGEQTPSRVALFAAGVLIASLLTTNIVLYYWNMDSSYLDRNVEATVTCQYCPVDVQPMLLKSPVNSTGCPPSNELLPNQYFFQNRTDLIFSNHRYVAVGLAVYVLGILVSLTVHDLYMYWRTNKVDLQTKESELSDDAAEFLEAALPGKNNYKHRPWMLLFIAVYSILLCGTTGTFGSLLIYYSVKRDITGYGRAYPDQGPNCACLCGYSLAWGAMTKLCIYLALTVVASLKLTMPVWKCKDSPVFLSHKHRVAMQTLVEHKECNGGTLVPMIFTTMPTKVQP